ncbi:MAG: DUF2130 domain-containing protein [Candidatus Pacebacteria bacterium]|nr:DUF2130 domain-containing protein [Candidatus Paceibacterota bacterium]PIR63178.1 MAG: hypothetical protein COU64_05680 [Candidatus Pacebacteria bacterium CG10_big_fil_rev_8_21_14_0_10_40_26]PIZ78208.1 MAG: hypothetical protein COY01_05500 [Candidatus Pacebacteria bacterium CG_4_10_14_0_2_um_filter_40_20]PJA68747.1 MAG: hypothetical protein CO156_04545 [Candidatus Pacebacteria bacterium CG_4_9_14_3_um_filter_40_12]PJC41687.1 MAG: hypothetical protein CO041_03135 [Candidatus Pacebacteria bact
MTEEQTITCPDCGKQIPLTKALSEQVEHRLKHQLEKQKEAFEKDLQSQLEEQLTKEKKRLWQVAQEKAAEKQGKEVKDLQEQLKENTKKLEESEKFELELRKKARDLEEKEKKIELEMTRKLDEERVKIIESTKKEEAEQQRLKMQEKDKQLDIMRKQIDDLKRKAEQGSMQIQGEVQEDDLRDLLAASFLKDEVTDVPQGIKGADLIQRINANIGVSLGTIIWESKNTKAFSDSWISKLKQDQGLVKAEAAILVSQVLPDDIHGFGLRNGVWVVSYAHVVPLASALRLHISEVSKVKQSLVGRDEKMELLYSYLSGAQFKNRIENIVMAFMNMKQDLETERRSFQRIWNKREKELEKVVMSTSLMYGDLQGIIGGSLPTIQQLELPVGDDSELKIESETDAENDEPNSLF